MNDRNDGAYVPREQLRTLLEGYCVWNTVALNTLTESGRTKLYKAQDLIEKIWNECCRT